MSIWLLTAWVTYLLGVVIQWLNLNQEFKELDEYSNFPIIWAAQVVLSAGCLLEALAWPYSLIVDIDGTFSSVK
ncbi:hypothetical protein [Nostoc sp. PCC 9305]|jgi:hypothetical protein|uniref:hypothetical protein n=1 Tax=Nostoc sp. PCC 9305 TaxID=296636 RepID=UPI0039C5EAFE